MWIVLVDLFLTECRFILDIFETPENFGDVVLGISLMFMYGLFKWIFISIAFYWFFEVDKQSNFPAKK